MVDPHGVASMDSAGLFHLLYLHRRAVLGLDLRVLAADWQPQPQQLRAKAGVVGGAGARPRDRGPGARSRGHRKGGERLYI